MKSDLDGAHDAADDVADQQADESSVQFVYRRGAVLPAAVIELLNKLLDE